VRVLVRKDTRALDGLDLHLSPGDLQDRQSLEGAFEGAQTVFHLAAKISIDGDRKGLVHQTNVNGVRNVIDACLKTNVKRLVHFSSIHAFQDTKEGSIIDETCPLASHPQCPAYDCSKADGLTEINRGLEKGLQIVTVHPTGIIGPFDYKLSRMGDVIKKLSKGKMLGLIEGGFNWVDVRDIVDGALAAEKHQASGERYILSGHWVSIPDLAKVVEKYSSVEAPSFVSPMWLAKIGAPFSTLAANILRKEPLYTLESLHALSMHRNISSKKAQTELGYKIRPFEETIKDTLDWMGQHNWV